MDKEFYNQKVLKHNTNVWIFQANPQYFNISTALKKPHAIKCWRVKQHRKDIKNGDIVLLWVAGKDRGIYAIAETASDVYLEPGNNKTSDLWHDILMKNNSNYWVDLRNVQCVSPIYSDELLSNFILSRILILRIPNRTNFRVSIEQWKELYKFLNN